MYSQHYKLYCPDTHQMAHWKYFVSVFNINSKRGVRNFEFRKPRSDSRSGARVRLTAQSGLDCPAVEAWFVQLSHYSLQDES